MITKKHKYEIEFEINVSKCQKFSEGDLVYLLAPYASSVQTETTKFVTIM